MPSLSRDQHGLRVDRFHRAVPFDPVPPAIRWMLVLPATITGWIAMVIAAALAGVLLNAVMGDAIAGIAGAEYRKGILGALAAFAWVVSGSALSPSRRRRVSVALFALGAWAAHWMPWGWSFPESHPLAYQISRVRFYVTLFGGVAGVAACWIGGDALSHPGQAEDP